MKGSMISMATTKKQNTLKTYLGVLEGIVWAVLILVSWWCAFTFTGSDLRQAIVFASAVSILGGLRGFLTHGGSLITATGLFTLSMAMFIGYSGLVLAGQDRTDAALKYVALACVAGLSAQMGTIALAWRHPKRRQAQVLSFRPSDANWITGVATTVLLVTAGLHFIQPEWRAWTEAAAFTAICFLTAGLILRQSARLVSWPSIAVLTALLLYSEYFHSGTGRLRLVALAMAVAVIFSLRFALRRIKVLICLIIPVALIWMAQDRLALQESIATGASEGRTGLESMIAPLNVFSLLLQTHHEQGFELAYGYNLLSVPALFVPEFVWPAQPLALGYELVQFYSPEKYGDGIYSTVASSTGEAFFNFGWLGLPLVIAFAALFLRTLDRALIGQFNDKKATVLALLWAVFIAMLIGAVADYTWSGVHTYAARMLARLPVFMVFFLLVWLRQHKSIKCTSEDRSVRVHIKQTKYRRAQLKM